MSKIIKFIVYATEEVCHQITNMKGVYDWEYDEFGERGEWNDE